MRTLATALTLCALAGLAVGCADDGAPGGADESAAQKLKAKRDYETKVARDRAEDPNTPVSSGDDPCAKNDWYGDGKCDSWCPGGDRMDCVEDDIACAAFFSPADGKCDWTNPCAEAQDEDCQKAKPDRDSNGDIVCTLIWRLPDGVCDETDPCSKVQDADCSDDEPVACIAIAYETNGKCEAAPGCEASDPEDCKKDVVCIEIAFPQNGKCEAAPGCEYTDPVDCKEPTFCTKIRYPDNGKCEAPKGCESNDPIDCAPDNVVCTAIRYADNGKCEAAPGCERNDPKDCAP